MIFLTKKDSHYSDQFLYKSFNFLNRYSVLGFLVEFDGSCRYELPKEDQEDINKLFGFSLGFNHHKDSARFGWFYKKDQIHLYSYTYSNSKRSYEFITKLELNKIYSLSIFSFNNEFEFSVSYGGELIAIKKVKNNKPFSIGYKLWPYFGGNNPAPHDIKISLTESV